MHTKLWGGKNSCNSSLLNSVTVHHEPNGVVARGTPHSAKTICSKNQRIYYTLFLFKDDPFQNLLFCVLQSHQINHTLYSSLHTTTFTIKLHVTEHDYTQWEKVIRIFLHNEEAVTRYIWLSLAVKIKIVCLSVLCFSMLLVYLTHFHYSLCCNFLTPFKFLIPTW